MLYVYSLLLEVGGCPTQISCAGHPFSAQTQWFRKILYHGHCFKFHKGAGGLRTISGSMVLLFGEMDRDET